MTTLDADVIMARATPLAHQQAHEIQPFGHLVRMPIALSENACKDSIANLNQLLAATLTSATCRSITGRSRGRPSCSSPAARQARRRTKRDRRRSRRTDQMLGGVSLAMAHDVAETSIPRPPKDARRRRFRSRGSCTRTDRDWEARDGPPRRGTGRRRHNVCWSAR